MEEQEVAPLAGLLREQLRLAGLERDADVAARDRGQVGGAVVLRSVRGRAAEREQPGQHVRVLGERLAAALDVELRHLGEQREQSLVAGRRHGGPQPLPDLGRRVHAEVDATVEAVVERVRDRNALAEVDPHDIVAAAQREGGIGARADGDQPAVIRGAGDPGLDEGRPVGHASSCHSVAIDA